MVFVNFIFFNFQANFDLFLKNALKRFLGTWNME